MEENVKKEVLENLSSLYKYIDKVDDKELRINMEATLDNLVNCLKLNSEISVEMINNMLVGFKKE